MSKEKFQIEFELKSSSRLLYSYLSSPSGLSEWFADNVNSRGEEFTFFWDDTEETAKLLKMKQDKYVRFRWEEDEETKYYFEMFIEVDDLTKDVSLIVTDFAEKDAIEEAKMLWSSQIDELRQTIGS